MSDAVNVSDITGRAWVFRPDYINTDAIMPRAGYGRQPSPAEAAEEKAAAEAAAATVR